MQKKQANKAAHKQRLRASWRTRACAAGWCVGAQVFLAGCAVGMPLAQNSVWIASLSALPFTAWLSMRCRCHLCAGAGQGRIARIGYGLLALTLLGSGAFAAVSLVGFSVQTLVQQSRPIWTEAAAFLAVLGCALGGVGAVRLCFALRYAMAALVLGLSLTSVPMRVPAGLFPILGAGAGPLVLAAVSMLFGAVPVLMLMLPPTDIQQTNEPMCSAVPDTRFFLVRVLLGALAGIALLFLSSVFAPYESIEQSAAWGARLRMAAGNQPHEGIVQMILMLSKLMAMLLLSVNMVCAAQQAWQLAVPRRYKKAWSWLLSGALLASCLAGAAVYCDAPVLLAAPLLAVPAAVSAMILGRRRGE